MGKFNLLANIRIVGWAFAALWVSGCAAVDLRSGFADVSAAAKERLGAQLVWNSGTELDREVEEKIQSLFRQPLNGERAMQLALLNNRELQAVYSDLGVAQADLVQAGLLRNPLFDASIRWPTPGGGKPEIDLSAAVSFLEIFYLPLRKRVAAARFEEAKSRVTGSVLDFAARVRTTFLAHQANEQMLELRQTIVQALTASFEVSRRLHEAGNIADLDFARERALLEGGKLALRSVEVAVRQSREELNILMGLWGDQTSWQSEGRLPDPPAQPIQTADIERVALNRSLDILAARQRLVSAGEQLGLNRWTALVPELHAGALGERAEGSWSVGPTLEFPIPLFDQGQGRISRAAVDLRTAQQEYYALAIRVRATARAIRDRMQGARDRALYYRDIMLPLQERIVNEAQLHYNAMQLGPIQLLRAREQQIETAVAYIEALRDYWQARADAGQILNGRLPASIGIPSAQTGGSRKMADQAGH